ncbi:MAG: DUF4920 domain-containing protein [Acidobacteriaceae bacterium]|nr:DUF4920 domain-containing protein [Acidobacteriaceae bacterium]
MKLVLTAALLATSVLAANQKLGKPLSAQEPLPLASVIAQSDRLVGKTVQVKGKVTEVCQMAGCWMNLTDEQGDLLRIKVEDGDIVFPKDSVGKMAIAEGKLEKHQMTREQLIAEAKHEAAESGRKFDPQVVKTGKTVYLLAGSGAVILGQ